MNNNVLDEHPPSVDEEPLSLEEEDLIRTWVATARSFRLLQQRDPKALAKVARESLAVANDHAMIARERGASSLEAASDRKHTLTDRPE